MSTTERDGVTVGLTSAEVNKMVDTSQWFEQEVVVPPQFAELLQKYSGLEEGQIKQHVTDVRKRAFDAWPYPCIGQLRFLELATSRHPAYASVLSRLKSGATYVDVGCCVGQDLRKLLFDGAPSSQAMAGIDVEPAFFDLGKQLFRDGGPPTSSSSPSTSVSGGGNVGPNTFQGAFYAADLTQPDSLPTALLSALAQKTDIVGIQSVFHLFGLKGQKALAHSLVKLLKPQQGSVVFGRQLGSSEAGPKIGLEEKTKAFAHSAESWTEFWDEVGSETGSRWKVTCEVRDLPEKTRGQKWAHESLNFLFYSVERL